MPHPSRVVIESVERRLLFATITVTNLDDTGAGSLRDAVTNAANGDTIAFAEGVAGTINNSSAYTITQNITIVGPGKDLLSIDPGGVKRCFVIDSGGLTLSDMTLTNGNYQGASGGAIYQGVYPLIMTRVDVSNCYGNSGGAIASGGWNATLSLTDCTFTNNSTKFAGGAIETYANSATFVGCTFANNSATAPATSMMGMIFGGSARGGAVAIAQGNVSFTNCTFTGNSCTAADGTSSVGRAYGGAVSYYNTGGTTFMNCTISGNSCTATDAKGGGLHFGDHSHTVTNSIIAGNTVSTGNEPDVSVGGTVTSGGYNIIGAFAGSSVFIDGTNHDHVGTIATPIDAGLTALADNGGETQTMALESDSPAVDAGTATGAPAADQRGQARVGATDIGAFEFVVTNTAPQFSSAPITDAGAGTLYSYGITATDGEDDDLTITAATKPAWLSITDNGDGTATLSGTPDHADYGSAAVTLNLSDGEETVEQSFTINVSVPRAVAEEDHVLHVNGSGENDNIHVWIRQGSVRVTVNGVIRNFDMADVEAVEVLGFGGDDSVLINVSTLPSSVFGGDGNDSLTGGAGNDSLVGGTGKDLLIGNDGDDELQGGGGKDRLVGSGGSDTLYGQAGDDLLFGRDQIPDVISGGADNDSAESDNPSDLVTTTENLLA